MAIFPLVCSHLHASTWILTIDIMIQNSTTWLHLPYYPTVTPPFCDLLPGNLAVKPLPPPPHLRAVIIGSVSGDMGPFSSLSIVPTSSTQGKWPVRTGIGRTQPAVDGCRACTVCVPLQSVWDRFDNCTST